MQTCIIQRTADFRSGRDIMLILTRHMGEKVYLVLPDGRKITISYFGHIGNQGKFGFTADKDIEIFREEIWIEKELEKARNFYKEPSDKTQLDEYDDNKFNVGQPY